jgi:hypothetical protein
MKIIGKTLIISMFIITFFEQLSFSQNDSSFTKQNKYNLSEFGHESVFFIKAPAHWHSADWIELGLVGAGTFVLYQYDQRVHDRLLNYDHNNPKYKNNVLLKIGNEWGGFFVGPLLCITLYTTGSFANSNKTKKIGFEIGQALIYSEVISFTSKTIIGRARPNTGRSSDYFTAFALFRSPYNSFPAGHTDAAFALSTVLAKNTDSYLLKVVAYLPAALTIFARVYTEQHWTSDVFIGSALGYFVGNWVVNIHDNKYSRVKVSSIYPLTLNISLN